MRADFVGMWTAVFVFGGVVWSMILGVAQARRVRVPAPLWVSPASSLWLLATWQQRAEIAELMSALNKASVEARYTMLAKGLGEAMGGASLTLYGAAGVASFGALCLGLGAVIGAGERARWRPLAASVAAALGLASVWLMIRGLSMVPTPIGVGELAAVGAAVGAVLASARGGEGEADAARSHAASVVAWLLCGVTLLSLAQARLGFEYALVGRSLEIFAGSPSELLRREAIAEVGLWHVWASAGVGALGLLTASWRRPDGRGVVGGLLAGLVVAGGFGVLKDGDGLRAEQLAGVRNVLPEAVGLPQVEGFATHRAHGGAVVVHEQGGAIVVSGLGPHIKPPASCVGAAEGCALHEARGLMVMLGAKVEAARLEPLWRGEEGEAQVLVGEALSGELEVLAGLERLGTASGRIRWSHLKRWVLTDAATLVKVEPKGEWRALPRLTHIVAGGEVWSAGRRAALTVEGPTLEGQVGVVASPGLTWQDVLARCARYAAPDECVVLVGATPPSVVGEMTPTPDDLSKLVRLVVGR